MTYEAGLASTLARIAPIDRSWTDAAWERLDSLTKPPRSLGVLEQIAARVAAIQRTQRPVARPCALVLMAGDHGVVAQGVSAYPQEVTMQMIANFVSGGAAINQLARTIEAELVLVDVGAAGDTSNMAGVVQAKVRAGTADMTLGPAMTREEAAEAIQRGVDVAVGLAARGVKVIGTGEMGIGNTTAAAAVTSALTGAAPRAVVGSGTGLDGAGVSHKTNVISRALELNAPDANDPLGVLAAVGGLELAGMTGLVLGAAAEGVCVVADGFISGAAALAAVRMEPRASGYVFPSHLSVEPGHAVVLAALELSPVLELDMRLGEGTGAALAMGIMRAACEVMSGMATFAEAGVSTADVE